jgi:D-alanine-D-alanine ligase
MTTHTLKRIAVFMGGKSHEAPVSVRSGCTVCSHLSTEKYTFHAVYLDPNGTAALLPENICPTEESITSYPTESLLSVMQNLYDRKIDVAFLALHGYGGEDGIFQGFLETLNIPYTHSNVLSSAISMDKEISKRLYITHDIPIPRSTIVTRAVAAEKALEQAKLNFPVVVKPPALGSSYEIFVVEAAHQLTPAVQRVLSVDSRAIIEDYIAGREFTCAVICASLEEKPTALPVTEIIPAAGRFFDTSAKYTPGATQEVTPADISENVAKEIQQYALQCHRILRCGCVSRTDFMRTDDGDLYVLETNSIPGMTAQSLLPQAAKEAGISFSELLDIFIEYAYTAEKKRLSMHLPVMHT